MGRGGFSFVSELGNLANLQHLYLHFNDLTGPIPPELGNLANLQHLYLHVNDLTGPIPPELGNLANLQHLYLHVNDLTGPIPPELGSLASLEELWLDSNDLTGPIPSELGNLTGLKTLSLAHNAELSGTLPTRLTNLRSLEVLRARNTKLCAPRNTAFQAWIETVRQRQIALCGDGPPAYLIQAAQSRELFPVPLVAGEQALLRVFVTATRATTETMPPVRARFYLDGTERHVADIPGNSLSAIPTDVAEGDLSKSANAEIPGDIVRPGLEMVVEIDPDGTLDPSLGVPERIPETGRMAVDVREMPVLDLTVIPFLWNADPDSAVVRHVGGMAADPERHRLLEDTRILLPVGDIKVTAHEPVVTSSNDALEVAEQVGVIRRLEGGRGHYVGMMSRFAVGGGLADTPGWVSVAVPHSATIAHELGHNMSLQHAPCGDAAGGWSFPYPDGNIGVWGYDFRSGSLVPPSTPDLMSYCDPRWISDYHFTQALGHRHRDEGAAAASVASAQRQSLLLWGGVDADGTPYLNPAFVASAPAGLPEAAGDHTVTGQDVSGGELFSLSFAMPEVADGDGGSFFVFALPARPEWAGALSSITLTGPDGSVTLDGESDRPMAILRDPSTGQVRGFLSDLPPATQAAMDAAGRAAGPEIEVLFSRGIPNAEAWRR